MDPLSALAASINTSIRLFDVTYQLKAVGQQTADLLCTTEHVEMNLNEARRLRRQKAALINPRERNWIDAVISDTDIALQGIARLIEPARVDTAVKINIGFTTRVLWVFRDNPQVRDKHARLTVCHQSLMTVISCLYSKDPVVIAPLPLHVNENQPPPYDPQIEELFEWRRQRMHRKSLKNLIYANIDSPPSRSLTSADPCSTSKMYSMSMSGSETPKLFNDQRQQSNTSVPAGIPMTQPTSLLSSRTPDIVRRPTSSSSVSTLTMATRSMESVANLSQGDDVRPIPEDWGRGRSKTSGQIGKSPCSPLEDLPRSTAISTISGTNLCAPLRSTMIDAMSDFGKSKSTEPSCENGNNLRLRSMYRQSDFETDALLECEYVNVCDQYSKAIELFPRLGGTSSTASPVENHCSSGDFSQTTHSSPNDTSASKTPFLQGLPDIESGSFTIETIGYCPDDPCNTGHVQEIYEPYRRPSTPDKLPSSAATSFRCYPSLNPAMSTLRPEISYNDGQKCAYDSPRYPGEARYIQSQCNTGPYDPSSTMAELDSNNDISASERTSADIVSIRTGRLMGSVSKTMGRSGRSWLMFHASRNDSEHNIG